MEAPRTMEAAPGPLRPAPSMGSSLVSHYGPPVVAVRVLWVTDLTPGCDSIHSSGCALAKPSILDRRAGMDANTSPMTTFWPRQPHWVLAVLLLTLTLHLKTHPPKDGGRRIRSSSLPFCQAQCHPDDFNLTHASLSALPTPPMNIIPAARSSALPYPSALARCQVSAQLPLVM